ncbi:hypothetical protein PoB_001326700 [Plakobranchus ocellatus]|uniref:Uncharacterized protein n=1 Tax=Plakobranchus ocellatus TaxID=259542 RepID=A0AAV3YUZ4_9GAST|nr:hypothetical protein PoB_001326700 [Plakobranchus ocellatus]
MVISDFKALRQAGAPMAGLEPATEGSLQISGRTHKPLCHRRPPLKLSHVSLRLSAPTHHGWNPVHNKVISGVQVLRQARAPVTGLEPATEGSL